jgi:hypothetical protein
MAVRIQLRRDTAANWVSANPTLRAGEIGIETDTLKFKVGNGSSPWNSITAYANVVPGDLNTTLNGYLETGDIGAVNGVVGLNADQDAIIPGEAIIFEGATADTYETTLVVEDPTADRTVTIPDATTTLVGRDTTDTLTNKTLTSPVVSGLTLSDASIVFEGAVADSYETTLTVGEPTADNILTLPDATDTLVGRATTDTLTNKTLTSPVVSGLYLSDSSIVFEGTANDHETTLTITDPTADRTLTLPDATGTVALTSDITTAINALSTTDIEEGTNQYFTDERAQDAVAAAIAAGTHTNITITYNDNANTLSFTGAVTYTDENAQDAVGNAVGNGLDYDDNTGAISVDPSEFALSAVGTPTANIDMGSYKITNLGTPTASGDAATKAYVDNTTAGLNFHAAVHGATTSNLAANYDNGTSGVGATLTADTNRAWVGIDSHTTWSTGLRVLVKNQTSALQNGIYVLTDMGVEGTSPWVLTRATDADNSPSGELAYGDFCFVQNGGQAGYGFIVNTTGTITVGTTAINYVQFNAGQVVVAGNGLTEATPGTLSIDTGVTVDLNTAQTLTNKTITGTFTGNLTGNADTVTNGVYTNTANTITAASASTKPLIIKGAASQTAKLQEWQDSAGTVVASVDVSGQIVTPTTIYTNGIQNNNGYWSLNNNGVGVITARTSTYTPLTLKAAASQSANLQEWQNSSGTVLASVASTGTIKSGAFSSPTDLGSYINFNSTSGAMLVGIRSASDIGMIVKSASSQSANLQEWQNSSGTVLANIDSSGNFVIGRSGSGSLGNGLITLQGVTAQSLYSSDNTSALNSRIIFLRGNSAGTIMSITSKGDTAHGVAALVITNGGFSTEITGFGYNGNIYTNLQSATAVGLTIKAASSQSANLQEWQNSSGTVLAKVQSNGVIDTSQYINMSTSGNAGIAVGGIYRIRMTNGNTRVQSGNGAITTLTVEGVASQTANLQEWQNSSGTVLASVNASGQFVGDGSQLTGLTTALTTPSTVTLSANTATTVDTTALSGFTSLEYMVSLKQGSKVRTSKVVLQTDGTSVDMTEFAITETGGTMSGVVISATTSGSDAVLQATVTDASSTNVTVKLAKIKL